MGFKLDYLGPRINEAIGTIFEHVANRLNPHNVTAVQVGALPIAGGILGGGLEVNNGAANFASFDDGNSRAAFIEAKTDGQNFSRFQVVRDKTNGGARIQLVSVYNGNATVGAEVMTSENVQAFAVTPTSANVNHELTVTPNGDQPQSPAKLIAWGGSLFMRNFRDVSNYSEIVVGASNVVFNVKTPRGTSANELIHSGNISEYAAKTASGFYVGSGTYSAGYKNSIVFTFKPKFVAIFKSANVNQGNAEYIDGASGFAYQNGTTFGIAPVSWSGNTMSWYANNADDQYNRSGETYRYIAIG